MTFPAQVLKGCETMDNHENKYTYEDLLNVIARLRGPDGCPWDKQQTHESLRKCMIEEAYETVEAINLKDDDNLKEELGDVLLQVVMHARIAGEAGRFDMTDVVDGVTRKMIRRHPHIFGNGNVQTPEAVAGGWEAIKRQEKNETSPVEGIRRVPRALPANLRAEKVLKKAAAAGYNFPSQKDVEDRVDRDFKRLGEVLAGHEDLRPEDVLGCLLFDLINLSRFLDVNMENSLTNVIEKFINRLESVESLENREDSATFNVNPQLMKALWDL